MLSKTGRYYYLLLSVYNEVYVRVSILGRLYLCIFLCRLVLDQLLGEGQDHKKLRILFDLGWPWKISPGFKFSPNQGSI